MEYLRLLFVVLTIGCVGRAQENAQTRIPESLMECYRDVNLMQRDYRFPMTMTALIDLIRKVENHPDSRNFNMRTLTTVLLHRFRLDGIVKAQNIGASSNVVPYSPQDFRFDKHKILLMNLLPSNNMKFPNASLTLTERCNLHHMISNSIESQARDNEDCSTFSQYRSVRIPRNVRPNSDVEVLDSTLIKKMNSAKLRMLNDEEEDPVNVNPEVDVHVPPGVYANDGVSPRTSRCPVETGVVSSLWGGISAGTLLAGIATGLANEKIGIENFIKKSDISDPSLENIPKTIDNRFAATLAGDLAEVVLRQGPLSEGSPSQPISTGADGSWNSTMMPKWYFLSQSTNLEYTDAEIRGGLDGLILAIKRPDIERKYGNSLKLSQLLEMYYSERGLAIDRNTLRASDRKEMVYEVSPTEQLIAETTGFSVVLDKYMQLQHTILPRAFPDYSTTAVDTLYRYIFNMNDVDSKLSKEAVSNTANDVATDIHIVLDTSWTYVSISQILSYILERINVAPFGSTVTLINGRDASLPFNQTQYLSEFYEKFNITVYQSMMSKPGSSNFDFPKILEELKKMLGEKLDKQKEDSSSGGQSSIILMFIKTTISVDTYINEQMKYFDEEIPDARFLYVSTTQSETIKNLAKDRQRDVFQIADSSKPSSDDFDQVNKLTLRVHELPKRLVNHKCGSKWDNSDLSPSTTLVSYVAPTMISYYRIIPNYFFKSDAAKVLVKSLSGTINMCYSRDVELPRHSNTTNNNAGVECFTFANANSQEIILSGACSSVEFIHKCRPFYVSIEGVQSQTPTSCSTEDGCRFADSVKYSIELNSVGCYSGAVQIILNSSILILSLIITIYSLSVTN